MPYEINARVADAFRTIGKGVIATKLFCATMNLPEPARKFVFLYRYILPAIIEVSENSIKMACQEAIGKNNSTDLTLALDGSWQKSRSESSAQAVLAQRK